MTTVLDAFTRYDCWALALALRQNTTSVLLTTKQPPFYGMFP